MLTRYSSGRHLLCRSAFSTVPYPNEIPVVPRPTSNDTEKIVRNDLIETKEKPEDKTPTLTSAEKATAGLTARSSTNQLFQDVKVSNTLVLPGIPVTTNAPPAATLTRENSSNVEEKQRENVPSSRFSAFLRSIRSGSPVFPSNESKNSSLNIALSREHFLPLARPSLIRLIATDQSFLNDEERLLFHSLCEGFDSAVVQRYHPILNELKHLFHPLNPDEQNRLDNEFWLLQKIDDLLRRSNFTELPRKILLEKFRTAENVQINGHDYDVLKFWILGREQMPREELSRWKRWFGQTDANRLSNEYFKRVILAVRLKGQDRLYFKAFRDVPLEHLPQLLPVGKLRLAAEQRRQIRWTLLVGSATAVTHLITTMAELNLPALSITGAILTGLMALRTYRNHFQTKIDYLARMNRILFYKNIASNKQLLGMIVDRAEDELSKEILLTYITILWKQKQNADLTAKILDLEVQNWIQMKLNTTVQFNSEQSIEFLRKLGILLPDDPSRPGRIQVIPLKQVVGILPKLSRPLSEKNEEWDLIEGYDKKYFELDWKTVLHEDKLLKKSGWN